MNPNSMWADFVANFKLALKSADAEAFQKAWSTQTYRTEFYRTLILRRVAQAMGYEFETELFKVDFAMWTRVGSQMVPVVFIESENAASTATHEIRKLAYITAPLRVLITVVEWDETVGVWESGGFRSELLKEWQSIVRAYNSVWPRTGLIGLIVGEWRRDNVLRFYARAIDPEGNLVGPEPDEIIFESTMARPTAATAKAPIPGRKSCSEVPSNSMTLNLKI
jgi:hypothetical protein